MCPETWQTGSRREMVIRGAWVAQLVKRLPSAQVTIPESWDGFLHWDPCSAGSPLLPLCCSPQLMLSLSLSNKLKRKKKSLK